MIQTLLGEFCNTSANARYDFALFKHQRRYMFGCDFENVQWYVTSVLYGLLGAPIHTYRPRLVSESARSAHSFDTVCFSVTTMSTQDFVVTEPRRARESTFDVEARIRDPSRIDIECVSPGVFVALRSSNVDCYAFFRHGLGQTFTVYVVCIENRVCEPRTYRDVVRDT